MPGLAEHFWELDVYEAAFDLQQKVFELTRNWPAEERYALTDQVRRSSRSIGACISEAWAKRRYSAHFISKLTDSDGELQETVHWLRSARACDYISDENYENLMRQTAVVGGKLKNTIAKADSFCWRAR